MKLTLELVAVDIRDKPTPHSSAARIELKIQNSKEIIGVENKESKPYSIHKFTINDTDNIVGDFWNLGEEEESILFASALSLSNEKRFFSTQNINFLNALKQKEVEEKKPEEKKPITTETNGNEIILIIHNIIHTQHIDTLTLETLKTSNLSIDGAQVLLILKKLVSFRIFDASLKRSPIDENIKESIEKYQEAMKSSVSSRESCYNSLYASFEKAVNADGKNREGGDFDKRAFEIAKLPKDEIKNLRDFNNRDKHPQKGEENIKTYEDLKKQFDYLITNLKKATDRVILKRLEQLGRTYESGNLRKSKQR